MSNSDNVHKRERLAWAVLVASFFICLLISVTIPVTASAYIQNATQQLTTTVQANQGTVGIDDETGVRRAVIAGEPEQTVAPGTRILTDATASAFLLFSPPNSEEILARLKVDSNTTIHLEQAATPRFTWSTDEQKVTLDLTSGRVRLTLLEPETRPIVLNVTTPQGEVTVREPGQYSLEVDNEETQVAVQEGTAALAVGDASLTVAAQERALIPTGGAPTGPLAPERNLIANGDFRNGFDNWSEYTWKVELADQPRGKTEITSVGGEPVLRFARGGIGHADARVRQSLNDSVSDYESLRLLVTLRIVDHSLGVCGVQGSECPLFVRVNYTDENGVVQTWQHGFYAVGEVDDNTTPGACISCAVIQDNHERVPLGQDYFYEVDLLEELARQGAAPPRQIESISLVASGHSFVTEVLDVALIAEE